MYQRVFFGPLQNDENKGLDDLDRRELAYLMPLVVLCFWIGLYPKPFFEILDKPVNYIVEICESNRPADTVHAVAGEAAQASVHEGN